MTAPETGAAVDVAALRELLAASAELRRELPELTGGALTAYSETFIANAFAKHAPGNEDDPDLRRVWFADAALYAAAVNALPHLLDLLRLAEESEAGWRREADERAAEVERLRAVTQRHRTAAEHSGYFPHKESLFALLDDLTGAVGGDAEEGR